MKKFKNRVPKNPFWDYSSPGAYFITICTKNKVNYFGGISSSQQKGSDSLIRLSEIGEIAKKNWSQIPDHFPFIRLDEYVIMPDHVHGILFMTDPDSFVDNGGTQDFASVLRGDKIIGVQNLESIGQNNNKFGPQSKNLASVIRGYKASVKSYATINNIDFHWHTRYHDRVIRNIEEYNRIRSYIRENPAKLYS